MLKVFEAVLAEPPVDRVSERGREDRSLVKEHARVEGVPLVADDFEALLQHARPEIRLCVPGRCRQGAAVVDHAVVRRHATAPKVGGGKVAEPRASSLTDANGPDPNIYNDV